MSWKDLVPFILHPSAFILTKHMGSMVTNNAVGWAQFQLNGGWRNTLTVVGAYAFIIVGLIVVSASIEPQQASTIYSIWVKGLMGLQMLILVLYASYRVAAGVRRDVTTGIIESHRLMPVPPLHAVVGYIFGGASQAMSLALANFLIGAATTRAATLPVDYWLKANFIVLTFAVFVWTMITAAALSGRGSVAMIVGPLLGYWFSGGILTLILPAVALLATPTQGVSVFDARIGGRELALYGVPMLCQVAIIAICLIAAVRKYRRRDDAALSPVLALALLAVVTASCVLGMRMYDEVAPQFFDDRGSFLPQFITSAILIMLLSSVVACAIAWADAIVRRAKVQRRREIPRLYVLRPVLGIVLIAAIGTALNYADGGRALAREKLVYYTAAIFFIHAMAICYLARWMYARVDRALVVVILWMLITWLGPLVIDLVIRAMADEDVPMSTIATWSPIGCMLAYLDRLENKANPRIGLLVQLGIGLVPVVVFHAEQFSLRRRATPASTIPTT
jgi:hypothetical protein